MAEDIRDYLIDRFGSDARTLRERAAVLADARKKGQKPAPGPDADVSLAMAEACDEVVQLAHKLPERALLTDIIDALKLMLLDLHARANNVASQKSPPVRSVYVGAGTRVQELITAEQNAASGAAPDESALNDADEDEE